METIIREAANVWLEQTEADREVLRKVQAGTIAECVRHLNSLGLFEAASELQGMK